MSIMVATGRGATQGVLFRDAAAIENLRKVDVLIVDKTGTLAEGRPAFEQAIPAGDTEADDVLRLAASLDRGSEHPLADAIVSAAREQGLSRSAENTSELQSLMRHSYAVFCLKKTHTQKQQPRRHIQSDTNTNTQE